MAARPHLPVRVGLFAFVLGMAVSAMLIFGGVTVITHGYSGNVDGLDLSTTRSGGSAFSTNDSGENPVVQGQSINARLYWQWAPRGSERYFGSAIAYVAH